MTEKRVAVRLVAEGGQIVRAEFEGVGQAGQAAFTKIATGQKSAEDSAKQFTAMLDREERAFEALRAAVDPAHAATKRYEAAVESSTSAVRLGIATQEDARRVMALAETQYLASGQAARTMGGAFSGNNMRNMGLQLNQVSQQAAATGDVMQALTIQAPDLLLGFGGIGIAAGIAAPLVMGLADAFFSAMQNGEDFDDALKRVKDTTDGLDHSIEMATATMGELRDRYGDAATRAREFAGIQAEIRLSLAQEALAEQVNALEDAAGAFETAAIGGRDYRNTIARVRRELGVTTDVAKEFEAALSDLNSGETFSEQQAALKRIFDFMEANNIAASALPPELARALDEMVTLSNETDAAQALMDRLSYLAGNANGQINGAANAASALSVNLFGAVQQMSALTKLQQDAAVIEAGIAAAGGGRIAVDAAKYRAQLEIDFGLADAGSAAEDAYISALINRQVGQYEDNLRAQNTLDDLLAPPKPAGGGGGGGGAGIGQNELNAVMKEGQRLTEQLRTEQEQYNVDLARADQLLQAGAISQETYNRQVKQLGEDMTAAKDAAAALESVVSRGKDAVIDAALGQADAFDQLANMIKRAAVEFLFFGSGPISSLLGGDGTGGSGIGSFFNSLFSFDGGGDTPRGPRTGGLDGRGGFLAMMHPNERVQDLTKGPANDTSAPVFQITVNGARGNAEIMEMVQAGVGAGLAENNRRQRQAGRRS